MCLERRIHLDHLQLENPDIGIASEFDLNNITVPTVAD
jgi:hypothetical protein